MPEAVGNTQCLSAQIISAPRDAKGVFTDVKARRICLETLSALEQGDKTSLLTIFEAYPQAAHLLAGIITHSDFLRRILKRDPELAVSLLLSDPEAYPKNRVAELSAAIASSDDEAFVMKQLRHYRRDMALFIALCDCGGVWTCQEVTAALTLMADTAVQQALQFLMVQAKDSGWFTDATLAHSGIVILAMGKHGAGELNYSSDTDLIVLYEPDALKLTEGRDPSTIIIRITKGLVRLLQEQTGDGYVLRVDLRLRPDPGSTPIAIPIRQALLYYESLGQNWERAAMIKARPIAGDLDEGQEFLDQLRPFIWRKYFDYAAIADIHAMKRQIYAHKGHETIAMEGHDIKLGRGGIREIEFFVQTQQLVFGGRRAFLRGRKTLEMLPALQQDGWISEEAVEELTAAYVFLRTIEHRLQMREDEQTQRLPKDAEKLDLFAAFCGFTPTKFRSTLLAHLTKVQSHYARLFEHGDELSNDAGNLVFTGVEDDQETLQTLRKMGFRRAELVAETLRGWHFGRRPAVTTIRAREVLTEVTPALLKSLGQSSDPDAALLALDKAFERMPAAAELLSILRNSTALRSLFAEILGSAPRLSAIAMRAPHMLDILVDPDFARPFDHEEKRKQIAARLSQETDFELFLERARAMAEGERFLIGSRALSGILPMEDLGIAHTEVAEGFLNHVFERTSQDFAIRHGVIEGAEVALLAYGKFGVREMTATSDLDLVLIYEAFDDAQSDGQKPLYASEYYAKLTQRLISAVSAQMRYGVLYDIDMRLRPSGNKGPLASSFAAFVAYQESEAEIWEHMSLSKARFVYGSPAFSAKISQKIKSIVQQNRDDLVLKKAVRDMRVLIEKEKPARGAFDLKLVSGGLLDLEFIAQYLLLAHCQKFPDLLQQSTHRIFQTALKHGILRSEQAETLITSVKMQSALMQFIRLTNGEDTALADMGEIFLKRLANVVALPDVSVLKAELQRLQTATRAIFLSILK